MLLLPTQHHSFFRNLPPLGVIFVKELSSASPKSLANSFFLFVSSGHLRSFPHSHTEQWSRWFEGFCEASIPAPRQLLKTQLSSLRLNRSAMLPHREMKSKKPGEQKDYENSYQEMNLWYLSSVTRTKCEIFC